MSIRVHQYALDVRWTGNSGDGTRHYRAYTRNHEIVARGKPPIQASSDQAFLGDATRYNPEELLVGSLSACHMLWYPHLCAERGIVVTEYRDTPVGTMEEETTGRGRFTDVVLRPTVVVEPGSSLELALSLHDAAHAQCFIANSVNFPVRCEARIQFVYR